MARAHRMILALGLIACLRPSPAAAEVSLRGWYFPLPFTLQSPNSPHRYGGLDIGISTASDGYAIAFPLKSMMTDAANLFIIDLELPLSVGVPDAGATKFYVGNPGLGFRANWGFEFPFAEGYKLPAAWAVGAEISVPLNMIWGGNSGYLLGAPMYPHDITAWAPGFVFRPQAQLALGKPMLFLELDFSLPFWASKNGAGTMLVYWALALGSQPDDLVSITLEFGGLHDLKSPDRFLYGDSSALWGALGARIYIGEFVTGVVIRLPFTKAYSPVDGTGNRLNWDPIVSFGIFVGYEKRHKEAF